MKEIAWSPRLALLGILLAQVCACVSTEVSGQRPRPARAEPVRRVAVAPFDNIADDAKASDIVTRTLVSELLAGSTFDVVDATASAQGVYFGPIERSRALDLGRRLGADAVLYGTILEYGNVRPASSGGSMTRSVAVSARLASVRTGEVLWSMTIVKTALPFFAVTTRPLEALVYEANSNIVQDLLREQPSAPANVEAPRPALPGEVSPAKVEHVEPTPRDGQSK